MARTTPATTPSQQCTVCLQILKSKRALAKHSLDQGHRAEQCCRECMRLFGSSKALDDHKKSSVHSKSQVNSAKGQSPALPSDPLNCRGNNYSRLSTVYQAQIYDMLVSSCHPLDCLKKQGYVLGAEQQRRNTKKFRPPPKPEIAMPRRKAVVLDCEMAGVKGGRSELIKLCIIDFLTGEILANSLVKPQQPIIEWRSHIHGITPAVMSIAKAQKQVFDGWEAARAELWRHINEDTILVGQSLNNDLQVLRVIHTRIVDSAILTAEAVYGRGSKIHRMWGLKDLCHDLLDLSIRGSAQSGNHNQIHDSLEDVLAAREVVLWCLQHPVQLGAWASEREKEPKRRSRSKKLNCKPAQEAPFENTGVECGDDEDEAIRWEDVDYYEGYDWSIRGKEDEHWDEVDAEYYPDWNTTDESGDMGQGNMRDGVYYYQAAFHLMSGSGLGSGFGFW